MNEEDVWCWKWPAWIQALRYMNLSLFLLSDKSNRRALTPSQSARECREILDIPYYKVQYDCWCTVIKESINGAMAPSHIWCIRWGWGFVWRWKLQHYQANNLKSLIPSINTTEIKTIHVTETKRKKKRVDIIYDLCESQQENFQEITVPSVKLIQFWSITSTLVDSCSIKLGLSCFIKSSLKY